MMDEGSLRFYQEFENLRIMDAKDILTIEDYKKRISDLIDELEKEIGIKIQNVDITPKVGLMNIRGVKFNIEL